LPKDEKIVRGKKFSSTKGKKRKQSKEERETEGPEAFIYMRSTSIVRDWADVARAAYPRTLASKKREEQTEGGWTQFGAGRFSDGGRSGEPRGGTLKAHNRIDEREKKKPGAMKLGHRKGFLFLPGGKTI